MNKRSQSLPSRRPLSWAERHLARTLAPGIGLLALVGVISPCQAQYGLALEGGSLDNIDSIGLQLTLPQVVDRMSGSLRVRAYPEIQLTRFERHDEQLTQVGGFAIGRLGPADGGLRPFMEVGLGGNLFSRDHIGSRSLSTRFQFGELLGLGVAWGGHPNGDDRGESWLGLRYVHFSNAGIRHPNDGLDNLELIIGHRF